MREIGRREGGRIWIKGRKVKGRKNKRMKRPVVGNLELCGKFMRTSFIHLGVGKKISWLSPSSSAYTQ